MSVLYLTHITSWKLVNVYYKLCKHHRTYGFFMLHTWNKIQKWLCLFTSNTTYVINHIIKEQHIMLSLGKLMPSAVTRLSQGELRLQPLFLCLQTTCNLGLGLPCGSQWVFLGPTFVLLLQKKRENFGKFLF